MTTCSTCRYYAPLDHEAQFCDPCGRCRRYPPQLDPVTLWHCAEELADRDNSEPHDAAMEERKQVWAWSLPVVASDDFCGEWAAKGGTEVKG